MKYTLLIFGLLWALGASGQIYINSFTFGAAPSAGLLLDDYPNAAAAYSLRLLRTAYTGNCVQVRRVSDGTLSDIGFSGNYLDTAALKTFCASTDCFVRTWYDQSTNARNAVMTSNSNQPQIISSGNLLLAGGLPSIAWDGSNDLMQTDTSGLNSGAALFAFVVYQSNVAAAANTSSMVIWSLGTANVSSNYISMNSSTGALTGETIAFDVRRAATDARRLGSSTYSRAATTLVQETVQILSSGFSFYQNSSAVNINLTSGGASTTDDVTPNNSTYSTNLVLGALRTSTTTLGGVFAAQRISEIVFYNTNVSSDRTGIEANQQGFY